MMLQKQQLIILLQHKMANQLGYEFSVVEESKTKYIVTIKKGEVEDGVVIDTLSDKCVVPVTQAKRTLEEETKVIILVRTEGSIESLRKFAEKNNYSFEVSQKKDLK